MNSLSGSWGKLVLEYECCGLTWQTAEHHAAICSVPHSGVRERTGKQIKLVGGDKDSLIGHHWLPTDLCLASPWAAVVPLTNTPSFLAEHDLIRHGISLWFVSAVLAMHPPAPCTPQFLFAKAAQEAEKTLVLCQECSQTSMCYQRYSYLKSKAQHLTNHYEENKICPSWNGDRLNLPTSKPLEMSFTLFKTAEKWIGIDETSKTHLICSNLGCIWSEKKSQSQWNQTLLNITAYLIGSSI